MTRSRRLLLLAGALMASASPATAQQSAGPSDSVRAQLRTTLGAFYFGLAHRDWEAMSAHILPAKVVAHRPVPEAVVAASTGPARADGAEDLSACAPIAAPLVDRATIMLEGDWAAVAVPRCAGTPESADRFRLIRFEARWWIVDIQLAGELGTVQLAR